MTAGGAAAILEWQHGSQIAAGSIASNTDVKERWFLTWCGSAILAAAGVAFAVFWFVAGAYVQAPEPPSCIRYQAIECLYKTDAAKPFQAPDCSPEPCKFDMHRMACDEFFAASGSFVRKVGHEDSECEDPFMEGTPRDFMPPCATACCKGDLPGGFVPGGSKLPGAQQWQPARDRAHSGNSSREQCSYFQYSSSEVLHFLQSNRVRVLVIGDSMQKQLHGRLVHMFRGSRRPVDNRIFAMARYALCRAGDHYAIASKGYDRTIKAVGPQPTLALMPKFFGEQPDVPGCSGSDRHVVIDSLYSGWYAWQIKHMEAYLGLLPPEERLIVVVGLNYIDRADSIPDDWFQLLDRVRQRTGTKLVVMSTPCGLVTNEDLLPIYRRRNKQLRAWAVDAGVSLVDFDAMSSDMNHPQNCIHDIHWACYLNWAGRGKAKEKAPGANENVLRDSEFGVPVASVQVTKDGECRDEMNRNLWQVIFNTFMKWRLD